MFIFIFFVYCAVFIVKLYGHATFTPVLSLVAVNDANFPTVGLLKVYHIYIKSIVWHSKNPMFQNS